jgi:hypothetical protein
MRLIKANNNMLLIHLIGSPRSTLHCLLDGLGTLYDNKNQQLCSRQIDLHRQCYMSVTNDLANGDRAVEALTLSDIEVDLDVPALGARNVEAAELLLADGRAVAAFSVVVGVDVRSSIGRGEAGGNIDPAQVVVNAEGDDEVLVAAPEAEDAGRTAAAHGEDLLVVEFSPGATVGVVPDCLFDDLEPGVGVGLVDAASDGVRHGSFCERSEFGGRTAIAGLLTWLGVLASKTRCSYGWILSPLVPLI